MQTLESKKRGLDSGFQREDAVINYSSSITNAAVHRCGTGGSMRACHVAGPGSIPGRDKFPV